MIPSTRTSSAASTESDALSAPPEPSAPAATAREQACLQMPPPRQRVFLPQTWRERVQGFWWSIVRNTLFRWSPPPCRRWRALLLRAFGAHIGRKTFVAASAHIDHPWNLVLGDHVYIAEDVIINCMGKVTVGERTRISQYSHLCAGTHDYQSRDMQIVRCPITVGKDVWIAADAFIGPGVTLGDNCVVAARSSAFRDMPAGQICLGEPARPHRGRDDRL
jgi:putative colanic acid biosynthesis acetyltransferase WcaF